MRLPLLLALSALSAIAQAPPSLRFTGQPIRVPYACSVDDILAAGLSCTKEEPCPVYLELAAVTPNGRKLTVTGNLHTESATLYSVLLQSDDGGETWKEPAKRIRAASLEQLEFYDFQNGWAAGEILYPLPHDPFFFVTSDGGQSWHQTTVGEEGSPGALQRFWFDSERHGELVIDHGKSTGNDRYSQYESENGGESWNIRATSSNLPVIRKAPLELEHPDWRIRSTKDGAAFQVEKRSGDNWTIAAAFLVHVSDCKPPEVELKEPPPDTEKEQKDFVEEMILKGAEPSKPVKKKKP